MSPTTVSIQWPFHHTTTEQPGKIKIKKPIPNRTSMNIKTHIFHRLLSILTCLIIITHLYHINLFHNH